MASAEARLPVAKRETSSSHPDEAGEVAQDQLLLIKAAMEEKGGDGALEARGRDTSTRRRRRAQSSSQVTTSSGSEGTCAASATVAAAEGEPEKVKLAVGPSAAGVAGEPPQGQSDAEDRAYWQRQALHGRRQDSGPSTSEGQVSAIGQEGDMELGTRMSSVLQRMGRQIGAERQRARRARLTMVRAENTLRRAERRVEVLEEICREFARNTREFLRALEERTQARLRDIDAEFDDALA
ncbi:transmembrane protein 242 isoform X1 [Ambystoma mexicanum]|uniref:transmembrane protein 242 isoform X1 n=1 Tax=Ambystoma mexicanum TaxID=8296 RepID=UPI0037E8AC81